MAEIKNIGLIFSRITKANKYFLFAFILLFFLYHLATIKVSPIPWFDETFFASITASFNSTQKLNLNIAPFAYNGEILLYGPVFFWITSFFTKTLGFDIFSFRLPGLVFGTLCLLVYYKVVRISFSKETALMVVAALALDPLFNSHMHYGRMEPVTLFFALTSIFVVLKAMSSSYRNSRSILLYALAGLLFSLALLTTPRVGVLLLGLGITQVYYLLKKPSNARALQLVVFSGSVVLVYVCWIFVAFGSLHNLVNYYLDFHGYIGGGFSFPKQQIPLIFITTVSGIAWGLVSYKRRMPELIVFSMVSAILYYSLVHDTGTYSLLILPACYTIIGSSVALLLKQRSLKSYSRLLVAAPILTIVLFNLLFFTIKFFTIYNTLDSRDPKYIDAFIKSYIPPNSKVIGDEIYYYAVSSANSDFQYIHLYKDDISREHYQRKIYGYDFIVMSHDLNRDRPELLQLYQRNSDLVKIAEFTQLSDNNFPLIDKVSSFFRVTVRSSYDCTIYKRVKEGKRLRTYFPVE